MKVYGRVFEESMCFLKPVVLPEMSEMIEVVLTYCNYGNKDGQKHVPTRIKEYVESRIGLPDYQNDIEFVKKLKILYLNSSLMEFKNNKWSFIQIDGEIAGDVSDTTYNGCSYRLVRNVRYNLPVEEKGLRLTSKKQYSEYLESKKDDKRFKMLLIDYKYIDEFWDKYPGGIMSLGFEARKPNSLI